MNSNSSASIQAGTVDLELRHRTLFDRAGDNDFDWPRVVMLLTLAAGEMKSERKRKGRAMQQVLRKSHLCSSKSNKNDYPTYVLLGSRIRIQFNSNEFCCWGAN